MNAQQDAMQAYQQYQNRMRSQGVGIPQAQAMDNLHPVHQVIHQGIFQGLNPMQHGQAIYNALMQHVQQLMGR